MRNSIYSYLELLHNVPDFKYLHFLDIYLCLEQSCDVAISIDCYDSRIFEKNTKGTGLWVYDDKKEDKVQSWNEGWRRTLVNFFNKRIDEVYNPAYSKRFKDYVTKLQAKFDLSLLQNMSQAFFKMLDQHSKKKEIGEKEIDKILVVSNLMLNTTKHLQDFMFTSNSYFKKSTKYSILGPWEGLAAKTISDRRKLISLPTMSAPKTRAYNTAKEMTEPFEEKRYAEVLEQAGIYAFDANVNSKRYKDYSDE